MCIVAVRRESAAYIKAGFATRNQIKNSRAGNCSQHLRHDVRKNVLSRNSSRGEQAKSYRRIEVSSGNVADRIGHSQNRQSEGEGHTQESNAYLRKSRGQDCTTATAEYKPQSTEEFCGSLLRYAEIIHGCTP